MTLYLFGGAETDQGQAPILKQLIQDVIDEIKPRQLLHIPYARIDVPPDEINIWGEGWVKNDLQLDGIELLDARNEADLKKAEAPVVFMNGGPQRDLLYNEITNNNRLYELVMNAKYIIGESAGSMVTAEYRRTYEFEETLIKPGLDILHDTIIEAHYAARNGQQALRENVVKSGAAYGLGIDSITGVIIDPEKFPHEYTVIGTGLVELIHNDDIA